MVFENISENVTTASTTVTSHDLIFSIFNYIQDCIWVIIIFLEFCTLIFFASEFLKKTTNFRTSYFIMLASGYAVDIFCQSLILRKYFIAQSDCSNLWLYIEISSTFYLGIYSAVWNISLILNRSTAIWFTFYNSKIWNFTGTFIVIIINFLSPYIIVGFMFFQPKCVIEENGETQNCVIIASVTYITIGSFTIISAVIMTAFVIFCSKNRIQTFSKQTEEIEKRLILQSIVCLILLSIYNLLRTFSSFLLTNNLVNENIAMLLQNLAMLTYIIQHCIEIFVLFIVSSTFRNAILKFYSFGKYEQTKSSKTVSQIKIFTRLPK